MDEIVTPEIADRIMEKFPSDSQVHVMSQLAMFDDRKTMSESNYCQY
jgi:hypothetical protein